MSVKSEKRFAQFSLEQFRAQIEGAKDRLEVGFLADRVIELEKALRDERARNVKAMACIERQRASITYAHHRNAELLNEISELKAERSKYIKWYFERDRAWRYVSRIVRDLCSPSDVEQWRKDNETN